MLGAHCTDGTHKIKVCRAYFTCAKEQSDVRLTVQEQIMQAGSNRVRTTPD